MLRIWESQFWRPFEADTAISYIEKSSGGFGYLQVMGYVKIQSKESCQLKLGF